MSKSGEESDGEIARLIESSAPGVEAAMQVLEGAETVYYGAIIATSLPEVVTTTTVTTPYVAGVEAP